MYLLVSSFPRSGVGMSIPLVSPHLTLPRMEHGSEESRLKEAFWLAQVPLMQIDHHLQATQLLPSKFNDLSQYGVESVEEFTQRLTIRDQ